VPEEIKLGGDKGSIVIKVIGYERPEADNQDDANWLKCALTVEATPFSGTFNSAFTTHDLVHLYEQLENSLSSLSGTVSFENTENDIAFDIEFNKRGGATLSGAAHPHKWLGASLQFRLETDQSYLAQTMRQLEVVLRRFPVKQKQP